MFVHHFMLSVAFVLGNIRLEETKLDSPELMDLLNGISVSAPSLIPLLCHQLLCPLSSVPQAFKIVVEDAMRGIPKVSPQDPTIEDRNLAQLQSMPDLDLQYYITSLVDL